MSVTSRPLAAKRLAGGSPIGLGSSLTTPGGHVFSALALADVGVLICEALAR
jgi:hypothetical protein